ncbi:phosphatase PAP2 family protein [Bacteroidota bacterium]
MKRLFLIFLLSLTIFLNIKGSVIQSDTLFLHRTGLTKTYFKSYLSDTKDFLLSPFKWERNDFYKATSFIGASALLFAFDKKIYDFFQNNRSQGFDKMSKYLFEPIGSGLYASIGFGALYLHGVFYDNDNNRQFGLLAAKTFLISGLMAQLSKSVFGRHRPYYDMPPNPEKFSPISLKNSSYISGHTTIAFSMATIIAMEFKDRPLIPVISYTLATFAGISRIYDNKHWATDVLGGAVIGYTVGRFLYKKNRNIKVIPSMGPSYTGISMFVSIN